MMLKIGDKVGIFYATRNLFDYAVNVKPMIEGIYFNEPVVKRQFVLPMTKRNNQDIRGLWNTSIIIDIHDHKDGLLIFTQNSIYKIMKLKTSSQKEKGEK